MPIKRHNSLSSSFLNSRPRSLKKVPQPYRNKMFFQRAVATVIAVLSFIAINTMNFVNEQIAVNMYVFPVGVLGNWPDRSITH